jgi:two-component system chemotaxis response regulator CheY
MMSEEHVLTIGEKENGDPYRCIVVDDSAFMVKNLRRMLNSFDAEVIDTAEDGQEAVDSVEEHVDELDFITLDITMPEMDGLEALDKIKEIAPDLKVIMVSAMGQEDTVKESIMKGAEHFIVKPFEREDVFEKLDGVLNG